MTYHIYSNKYLWIRYTDISWYWKKLAWIFSYYHYNTKYKELNYKRITIFGLEFYWNYGVK